MEEYEQFVATIRAAGNGVTLEITIPQKTCMFAGFKEGDLIKVLLKKMPENVE